MKLKDIVNGMLHAGPVEPHEYATAIGRLVRDYGDYELTPPQPEQPKSTWDLSSNHPEMKRCVICGEKDVRIEAGYGPRRGAYRCVCRGDHAGNATPWRTFRQGAIDAWNANKAPFEVIPEQPKPEPEAWAELRKFRCQPCCDMWTEKSDTQDFESAWPEIERRVRKMIDEAMSDRHEAALRAEASIRRDFKDAIKAERDRLVRALRKNTHWALREMADKLEGAE